MRRTLSPEQILAVFDVDRQTGKFYWRVASRFHKETLGKEAGCARKTHNRKHYWVIVLNGVAYKRSALMLCLKLGMWPQHCVDHINGDSLDDNPCNLREATSLQNAWNHKFRKRRIKLPMGVRLVASGRYQARIGFYKKQIHLGTYETPGEAERVYREKRKELYGEFA